jgi:hypothetical protein
MLLNELQALREVLIVEAGPSEEQHFIEHDGEKVYWEVSPCSWMYKHYGMQIQLSLKPNAVNAASEFVNDKSIKGCDEMKAAERNKLGRELAQKWLTAHGTKPLHAAQQRWDKVDAEYDAKMKKSEAGRKVKQQKQDDQQKAKGFTHRLDGWLHVNGDDRQVQAYFKGEPKKADIDAVMKKSAVKDDYKLTKL